MTRRKDDWEVQMFKWIKIKLNLFDGEAEGSSAPSPTPSSNVGVAHQTTTTGSSDLSNVKYGKVESTDPLAKGTESAVNTADRESEFKKLIKGDYKDLYSREVESIIKDRFKKYEGLDSELEKYKRLAELSQKKHGVNDVDSLITNLEDEVVESMAYEEGLTPEQMKRILTLQEENKSLKTKEAQTQQTQEQMRQEEALNKKIDGWLTQADDLIANHYPDFDFETWAENEKFMKLLHSGVDLKTVYEVMDGDNVKAQVAKKAEQNTVTNIQSKSKRPKENGLNSSTAVTIKSSPKDWTKEDRAEVKRRVRMGEIIKL